MRRASRAHPRITAPLLLLLAATSCRTAGDGWAFALTRRSLRESDSRAHEEHRDGTPGMRGGADQLWTVPFFLFPHFFLDVVALPVTGTRDLIVG